MNDPEVIMPYALPGSTGLVAHSKALKAAGLSIALVTRVPAPLKCMADLRSLPGSFEEAQASVANRQ